MKGKSVKDWVYVSIQLVFFVLYFQDFDVVKWEVSNDFKILFQLIAGMGLLWSILAVLSMNSLVSPFPSPKDGMQLQTNGVYAFSRHPIYSGILILFYAWGIAYASEYKIAIGFLFHVFIYFKAFYEEELLQQKFPEYKAYKKKTGMFFPKLFHSKTK
ncbi:methyltransferase family protein [Psychroflexus planctonicus]|uniref:Protein-S-isoprenylcysteine O-methyltransferase Ste14 n=1 Tax=Psychroflexus planctonicus TaxID=1526575 RepID=A0ABQ1SM34_9FLAO|nr:isoprenylcysteine carboxylmethyltransferase family protein [Psychroflexus planctonicus]GGE43436.1 hypothetical protein GCM10010832_24240 [Psychroflexus planctonicus]